MGFDELISNLITHYIKLKLKDLTFLKKKTLCTALNGLDYLIFVCLATHSNDGNIKNISGYKITNGNSFHSYNTFFGIIILPGKNIRQSFNNVPTTKCLGYN